MREERGQISGKVTVSEPFTLWGSIAGDVTVVAGGKFYVRGSIYGSLDVAAGGRVHIFGNVQGNLKVHKKAKVIHSGTLGGDAINLGGRLYVELAGKILGKVKTKSGETTFEQPMRIGD